MAAEMKLIFDNKEEGDGRFILEEGDDGLLYETTVYDNRKLVCKEMFEFWPEGEPTRSRMMPIFGGRESVADRYIAAANDLDKPGVRGS